MQANVKWVEGNTYIGRSNSNHNVVFDAGSDGAAPSPMEMVLMSVGGCSSVDVVSILKDSIKGEQCAISIYSNLADMTRDKDIVTYDLVSEILADEVEHEEDLQALYDDITEFVSDLKKSMQE